MSVRLYAVLRLPLRSNAALPPGLRAEHLRIVKCAGFSVAIANCDSVLEPEPENLFEFDRIIRALASVSEAILPARFGVVARSVRLLKSEIADSAGPLAAALDQVAGRVQMTVRIPPRSLAEAPVVRAGKGHGAEYLRTRAAASTSPALTKLREAVADLVRAERLEPGPAGVSVYHLIKSSDVTAYRGRVLNFRVSGPFPPYAFVPGIDHALWPGHDDQKDKRSDARPSRSRARRRSARNANR